MRKVAKRYVARVVGYASARRKRLLYAGCDVAAGFFAFYLAFLVRFDFVLPRIERIVFLRTVWGFVLVQAVVWYGLRVYRGLWAYTSLTDVVRIIAAVGAATLLQVGGMIALRGTLTGFPRSIFLLNAIFFFLATVGMRAAYRLLREFLVRQAKVPIVAANRSGKGARVLIVGAGNAGEQTLREIRRHGRGVYDVVGFLDDSPEKRGSRLHGVEVIGQISDLPVCVKEREIDEVVLAIPSLAIRAWREIYEAARVTGAEVRTIPSTSDLVEGRVTWSQIRKVQVGDLLAREQVTTDMAAISAYLNGKTVLVSGGGGSIGQEICRQVARFRPRQVVCFGKGENSLHDALRVVREEAGAVEIVPAVGSFANRERLRTVMERFRPEIVFHAGAHKHVYLMEAAIDEAVMNNVGGTQNLLAECARVGTERVVVISTDKAADPESVMGATKRVTELLAERAGNSGGRLRTVCVRFGNVLGSRGSVVPLFERQIASGGPVTVTSRKMRRYFMTIPEAVQLVIQAGAIGAGGEIFALRIGEPVRIWDLAEQMIRLSGLVPHEDIEIIEVGPLPGERLTERLAGERERLEPTGHSMIDRIVTEPMADPQAFDCAVEELLAAARRGDIAGTRALLCGLCPTLPARSA